MLSRLADPLLSATYPPYATNVCNMPISLLVLSGVTMGLRLVSLRFVHIAVIMAKLLPCAAWAQGPLLSSFSASAAQPPALPAQTTAAASTQPNQAYPPRHDFQISSSAEGSSVRSPERFIAPSPRKINGFFKKNAAQSIFRERVAWDKAPQIEYFPVVRPIEDIGEEEELTPQQKPEEPGKKKYLPDAQAILEEYGDPSEDPHVLAQPDAPAPFKAVMAALEIGDEKLAYKFARQWARYISNVNERTLMVTGLTGLAMKTEGRLDDGTWVDDPQFKQYRHLAEADLLEKRALQAKAEKTSIVSRLDQKAQELLQLARDEEESAKPATNGFTNMTNSQDEEKLERQQARAKFAGHVPVDPQGQVAVFFFIRLRDNDSLAMAPAIEALYRSVATDAQIAFTAICLDNVSSGEVRAFHAKTGTTFPITQGDMLAQAFNVRSSPTSVFMTSSTSESVTNQGVKSYFFLDELLKTMRGGRK